MEEKAKRLALLKKKQEQLKAQIQALESAEKSREKKRETRRKILVGAFQLDKAREEGTLDLLYQQLDHYLNREADRILFNFAPLEIKSGKNRISKNAREDV